MRILMGTTGSLAHFYYLYLCFRSASSIVKRFVARRVLYARRSAECIEKKIFLNLEQC